jgi:uncharacterized protein (TIGR00304 family)
MNPLLLVGIVLIILGFVFVFLGSLKTGEVKAGGVVVIGPFPVIFGSDRDAALFAGIAAIIIILALILWFVVK